MIATCGHDGCTDLGPFTTDDGPRCFQHAEGSNSTTLQAAPAALAQRMNAEAGIPATTTSSAARPVPPADGTPVFGGPVQMDELNEAARAEAGDAPKAKRKRAKRSEPAGDLNDTAARALASIILSATADALSADTERMERAVVSLASDLPAPLEVSAGILFAMTAVAGAAGLTDVEVFTIGAAFEDVAEQESESDEPQ